MDKDIEKLRRTIAAIVDGSHVYIDSLDDARELRLLLDAYVSGDVAGARKAARGMDTIVRDLIPQRVFDRIF